MLKNEISFVESFISKELKGSSDPDSSFIQTGFYHMKLRYFVHKKDKIEALKVFNKYKQLLIDHKLDGLYYFKYLEIAFNTSLQLCLGGTNQKELLDLGSAFKKLAELVQNPEEAFLIHYNCINQI